MEDIYASYDLYDQTLDFFRLLKTDYIRCYEKIEKAIEIDLNSDPVINNRSQDWMLKAWYEEIKPKMQASSLYDLDVLGQ